MPAAAPFLLVTCQIGAERAVKAELARLWPEFRFAYSRPGFITFKLPTDHGLEEDFDLRSVFARAYAFSLGKVVGENAASGPPCAAESARAIDDLAAAVWQLVGERRFDRLHVWQRDQAAPGDRDYEPGLTPLAHEVDAAIRRGTPTGVELSAKGVRARRGQRVLDCVLVEPGEWWLGHHRARGFGSRLPGGLVRIALPPEAVSRAWLKMEEALRWSRLPIEPGDECVEIGCAPGGACQVLLRRGLLVKGIDPALVHPIVAGHPNFTQIRKRGSEVKRREFRRTRWIVADMNVVPSVTLDMLEAVVTHRYARVKGILATLKLADWGLADRLPEYLERIRSWGFSSVRARQLQFNRQEVCIAALRKKKRIEKSES